MWKKLGITSLTFSLLMGLTQFSSLAADRVKQYRPDPKTPSQIRDYFMAFAARSYMPGRSGDVFALPKKYNFVTFQGGDYSMDGASSIVMHGEKHVVQHKGTTHSIPWSFDIEIPIILYGPGFVNSGLQVNAPVTQQDLAPTYASILNTSPPADATHGRPLYEAFFPTNRTPKAILTLVFDQGGLQYYNAHPDKHPNIDNYIANGTFYNNGRVTHLDVETGVGHTAIGTGAYPYQHGVMANQFFFKFRNWRGPFTMRDNTPAFINSPSFADVWDVSQGNRPIVVSYAYAPRAAMGMAGHGAQYTGGDKDIVYFYSRKTGKFETNSHFYTLPNYLKDMNMTTYIDALTNKTGKWMGHDIRPFKNATSTPAQARFDADAYMKILEREPIGQDNVTDLLYLTLKATDSCGHDFSWESQECGEVFAEQDKQAKRIIDYLEKKVGRDNLLVVITADHGASPLPELNNGIRINSPTMIKHMNAAMDHVDNGVPLVDDITGTQFYINDNEMRANGWTWRDIQRFIMNYRINGRRVYATSINKKEIIREQLRKNLISH